MTFQDLNNINGLQFMPVRRDKRPIHQNWQNAMIKYDYTGAEAAGLVCGSISMNTQAIDIDLKYDITGSLLKEFIDSVNSIDSNLLSKLVIQKTISNGYHLIFRCSEIEGNKKLANRESTFDEKQCTYLDTLQKEVEKSNIVQDLNNPQYQLAMNVAKKAMDNDKTRVLIETRGEKGYIAIYPTPGYEIIQGSLSNIPEITPDERQILLDVSYSFNSYFSKKEDKPAHIVSPKTQKGKTPSEDFNDRGDVVALLESHGWTVTGRRGNKILLRRPGNTNAKDSGNYDTDLKWFSVFSTSTEFESQKPYKPYAVFAMLECGGDYSKVTKKLADLGYGDPLEKIKESNSTIPSIINMVDEDDYSFLATSEDYDDYINKWLNNSFVMGLSTGVIELDKYFLFKRSSFVMVNGIDNVGKSTFIWYLHFLAALYHGWKGIIFSSENKVGAIKKKIMEFYWCKTLKSMSAEEIKEADLFFNNHFRIIKNADKLYNYQDILNMVKKTLKIFKADMLLIDPYNSLKVESSKTYEYHYEAASILKLFGDENDISIYLNTHAGTSAARKKDNNGFTMAPEKEDSEMGVMFPNKADDFLTIHRLTQHDTDFMYTELHVRKIKDTETGGRPTPKHKPIYFRSCFGLVGFEYVTEKSVGATSVNPVKLYWDRKKGNTIPNVFNTQIHIFDNNIEEEEDAPF